MGDKVGQVEQDILIMDFTQEQNFLCRIDKINKK